MENGTSNNLENWISKISVVKTPEEGQGLIRNEIFNQEWDEPFFVGNLQLVVDKYNLWKSELPDIDMFYAVKSNDDPLVIKLLAALGSSFDCASKGELDAVLSLGVTPDRIMLSNPYKFPTHLAEAAEAGIRWMVCDSSSELHKIAEISPEARVVLRIHPRDERTAYIPMSSKFGCDIEEATAILKEAKDLRMNIVGISFYVGHCTESPVPYEDALRLARDVYDVAQGIGHKIMLVDIGGGFQGAKERRQLFHEVTSAIKEAIRASFGSLSHVRFIGEPGQFMCIQAFDIYVKVIGIRYRKMKDGIVQCVYVSGGHFGCLPNYCFNYNKSKFYLISKNKDEKRSHMRTVFWGPTCDPMDRLTETDFVCLYLGDCLKVTNVGSYVRSIASNYNGFKLAPTKYIVSPEIRTLMDL